MVVATPSVHCYRLGFGILDRFWPKCTSSSLFALQSYEVIPYQKTSEFTHELMLDGKGAGVGANLIPFTADVLANVPWSGGHPTEIVDTTLHVARGNNVSVGVLVG